MRGVKPGDRVLLIGENSPEWVLAYFAILAAGAVAVPLESVTAGEPETPPEDAVKVTGTPGTNVLFASRTNAVRVASFEPSDGMD